MSESPRRAVIYTRISRDDTGDGKSNERQEHACRQFAEMRGWTVVAVEEDISLSAYKDVERPGWSRVLDRMSNGGVEVVLAWKLDRVTRSVRGLVDIVMLCRDTGVSVATTDGMLDLTSPTGKAVATILAAVGEMEVELKGERQRLANKQRATQGLPWPSGWAPLGYTRTGVLLESEAERIQEAARDVLRGTSLKAIARRWNEQGVTTARNARGRNGWSHNGVRSVLLNPRYAGYATYRGDIVGRGQWTPILSEDTHALLVSTLTDKSRATTSPPRSGRHPANLLSGIAVCSECGERVTGGSRGRQVQREGVRTQVARVPVYRCPNNHLATDREEIDDLVRSAFARSVLVTLPGSVIAIPKRGEVAEFHDQRQLLTSRLEQLGTAFGRGALSMDQVEAATAAINEQLAQLERSEANVAALRAYDPSALSADSVTRFLEQDLLGQRDVLKRLAVIKLFPKGRGRRNVPIGDQLEMSVKQVVAGKVREIPAFRRGDGS